MWWSVVTAGACAALGAWIARMVVEEPGKNPAAFFAVLLTSFLGLNVVSRAYLLPEPQETDVRGEAEAFIEGEPLFSLLVREHPELRERLVATFEELARERASVADARRAGMEVGRQMLWPYAQRYLPSASGASIVAFVELAVVELDRLRASGGDVCYRWMFGGPISDADLAVLALTDADGASAAMVDVVESALSSPQAAPDPREAEPYVEELARRLISRHGEGFLASLALLERPQRGSVNRRAACETTAEVFREALRFSSHEREVLLRHLVHAAFQSA